MITDMFGLSYSQFHPSFLVHELTPTMIYHRIFIMINTTSATGGSWNVPLPEYMSSPSDLVGFVLLKFYFPIKVALYTSGKI